MQPFIGQLALFAFNLIPKGWAPCNGQLLPINSNQALFSLLGTNFGGNGTNNFALPNLQGRVAPGVSNNLNLGQTGGEEFHTLTAQEVPGHTHSIQAASGTGKPPQNNVLGTESTNIYTTSTTQVGAMNAATVASAGNSNPHENRTPFLVMQWCIALTGIYPSRN